MIIKILQTLVLPLKSRTVWTILALFIINGITGIREFIPIVWLPILDAGLGLSAIYFRVKPRAEFKG